MSTDDKKVQEKLWQNPNNIEVFSPKFKESSSQIDRVEKERKDDELKSGVFHESLKHQENLEKDIAVDEMNVDDDLKALYKSWPEWKKKATLIVIDEIMNNPERKKQREEDKKNSWYEKFKSLSSNSWLTGWLIAAWWFLLTRNLKNRAKDWLFWNWDKEKEENKENKKDWKDSKKKKKGIFSWLKSWKTLWGLWLLWWGAFYLLKQSFKGKSEMDLIDEYLIPEDLKKEKKGRGAKEELEKKKNSEKENNGNIIPIVDDNKESSDTNKENEESSDYSTEEVSWDIEVEADGEATELFDEIEENKKLKKKIETNFPKIEEAYIKYKVVVAKYGYSSIDNPTLANKELQKEMFWDEENPWFFVLVSQTQEMLMA